MLLKANWLGTEVFLKHSVVQVQVTYTHNIKTGLCEVGSSRGPIEVNTTDTDRERGIQSHQPEVYATGRTLRI